MPAQVLPRVPRKALIPAVFVALPAVLFYAILFREAINVPLLDDYEALLDFLNRMAELKSVSARASYFLASQFNEYKLFFGHGVAWLQLAIFGHMDIRLLCALGNASILLLAVVLWRMFLPNHQNLTYRMALFIPVSWLLFQLQYAETLNWAMPSLQNLPVLSFSLGAICLLMRSARVPFCGSLVCFVLAVASSGNGFSVDPYRRAGPCVSSPLCAPRVLACDFCRVCCRLCLSLQCHVVTKPAQSFGPIDGDSAAAVIRDRLHRQRCSFPHRARAIFLLTSYLAFFSGLLLCAFFVVIVRRGYVRRNPMVAYCILFLLLTAIGVAGLRSDLGLAQSLGSRYAIYSALFLYLCLVRNRRRVSPARERAASAQSHLTGRDRGRCSVLFKHGCFGLAHPRGAQPQDHSWDGIVRASCFSKFQLSGRSFRSRVKAPRLDELDRRAPAILRQSTNLRIYEPPSY